MYLVTQICLTLWVPMKWSPPDSSVHGVLQARILGWVAISFSWGSPRPRGQTCLSYISWIGGLFTIWGTREHCRHEIWDGWLSFLINVFWRRKHFKTILLCPNVSSSLLKYSHRINSLHWDALVQDISKYHLRSTVLFFPYLTSFNFKDLW